MGMMGWDVLMFAAMMGAERPAARLRNDAMPVPVPRFGAGNTSGVLLPQCQRQGCENDNDE